jgi:hypothetical protein
MKAKAVFRDQEEQEGVWRGEGQTTGPSHLVSEATILTQRPSEAPMLLTTS